MPLHCWVASSPCPAANSHRWTRAEGWGSVNPSLPVLTCSPNLSQQRLPKDERTVTPSKQVTRLSHSQLRRETRHPLKTLGYTNLTREWTKWKDTTQEVKALFISCSECSHAQEVWYSPNNFHPGAVNVSYLLHINSRYNPQSLVQNKQAVTVPSEAKQCPRRRDVRECRCPSARGLRKLNPSCFFIGVGYLEGLKIKGLYLQVLQLKPTESMRDFFLKNQKTDCVVLMLAVIIHLRKRAYYSAPCKPLCERMHNRIAVWEVKSA